MKTTLTEKAVKRCNRCNEIKPLEMFKKDRRNKSGYDTICKRCHSARVAEYYRQEGERVTRQRYNKINARVREFDSREVLEYSDFLELVANDNPKENHCAYCGKSEQEELEELNCRLAVEHIQPLKWGTPHAYWNVTLACKSCNSSKANTHVLAFYRVAEQFTEERLTNLIAEMARRNGCDIKTMEYLLFTSYMTEEQGDFSNEVQQIDHGQAIKEITRLKQRQVKAVI